MSILYYHPLGEENYTVQATTYYGHGIGKLDFPVTNQPIYAMCDGTVAFCGTYSDGVSCCAISCYDNGLNTTFYIRYLHGIYNVQAGDNVIRGQCIGQSSDVGSEGSYHLHIDFSQSAINFIPVQGDINFTNKTFIYNGISFPLLEDINYNAVQNWMNINGAGGNLCGFCWLVIASKLEIITPSSSTYDPRMDASRILTSLSDPNSEDWLPIYGMWKYEEGGIFTGESDYEKAAGISEWVVRVFRNRLIAGTSIDSICLWNSGLPGRTQATALGKQVDEETREFIRNIILGNNYFYVESLALKYRYRDDNSYSIDDDELWQRHLYAADTFYGAGVPNAPRWLTLAVIPSSFCGYFYMEGVFSENVQILWNQGYFYENPYFNN